MTQMLQYLIHNLMHKKPHHRFPTPLQTQQNFSRVLSPFQLSTHPSHTSKEPTGTIVFSTVGRCNYGFDIFSVKLPTTFDDDPIRHGGNLKERCLTDGVSINYNGQFIDDEEGLVFISERSGSPQIFMARSGMPKPERLSFPPESLFHDRPVIKGQQLYFVSAHEKPDEPFKSWSAVYSTPLREVKVRRLTPPGCVDYSPAVSGSGKWIVVASYGSRSWEDEFHELKTDIVVFPESDPDARVTVCQHGGWPTWSGDSTIYFHRQADDGWWSIYRVDLPSEPELSGARFTPIRVTPPGIHCFTPTATKHNSNRIAVSTRRRNKNYRHVEIYDIEAKKFHPISQLLNPNFHCYNPFFSAGSSFLGYHRFRGESVQYGECIIPHLEPVNSPVNGLKMLRINGSFPSFSPSGDFIAFNHELESKVGLKVLKSDGSRRWLLSVDRSTFFVSWSPVQDNVIFTSVGPIFASSDATVQIARVTFDSTKLTDETEEIPAEMKVLTKEGTSNNAFPSCSPDGKFIVFRSGRSGHKNLYIIDAFNGEFDGGDIRQLTNGQWIDTMPSWSPDGKLIAFSSNMDNPADPAHFSLYVISPDGSGLRRIRLEGLDDTTEFRRERLNHVCWSADSEWLVFTANLAGVTAEPVSVPNQFQPYGDLFAVRLDGSGLRRLTWNGYENGTPAWHPRGSDVGLDIERLNFKDWKMVGDKLMGKFDEPLWLHCDV